MWWRILIVGITCWLLPAMVAAQEKMVTGTVKEESGAALPNAQVILRKGPQILAYALTDTEGAFSLALPSPTTDSLSLEIRFFGFAARHFAGEELTIGDLGIVQLQPQNVEIQEVTVAASALPRVDKGDTTVFQTERYRDGSEDKIEEVIAKIPGAEVDEEGNITVDGKPLDRILVDGEDLFDKNYKLLSKNVPADYVERIDVIRDYHSDALVGDLSGDRELVMNLHLDENRKGFLFGEANAELGSADYRFANLNLFHFGKKTKAVNFSDYGTLGRPSSAGSDLLIKSQGLDARPPNAAEPVLRSAATRQMRLVRPRDYLVNNAFGSAQSILTRLNPNLKNRLVFNLAGDHYNLSEQRLRENLNPGGVDSFLQVRSFDYRINRFWLTNDLEALLNAKSRLDVRISALGALGNAATRTLHTNLQENATDELSTQLRDRPLNYLLSLRYVRRLNPQLALRLSGSLQRQRFGQEQDYRGDVYQSVLAHPENLGLTQLFNQRHRRTRFEADLLQQAGKFNLNHTVGWRQQRVATDANLAILREETSRPIPIQYLLRETYLRTTFRRTLTKVDVSGGLTASLFALPLTGGNTEKATRSAAVLQPNVRLGYSLNRRNQLEFWTGSSRDTQGPENMVPTPYLASGATLSAGLDSAYLFRRHSYGLSYRYTNNFAQYGYGLQLFRSHTPNDLGRQVVTDNFVVVEQLTPGARASMTSVGVSGDKHFSRLRTNVKLSASLNRITSQIAFGGAVQDVLINSGRLSMIATTKLIRKMAYSLQLTYDRFGSTFSDVTSQQAQAFVRQDLIYRPTDHWNVSFRHRAYFPRLGTAAPLIHLLSGSMNYDIPDSKFQIGCGFQNLLNQGSVRQRNVAIYQRSERSYRLRPRTIYGSVGYEF